MHGSRHEKIYGFIRIMFCKMLKCNVWFAPLSTRLPLWKVQQLLAVTDDFVSQNAAVISPKFLVWKFCGNAQCRHSFGFLPKRCASKKLRHQEIRKNYWYFTQRLLLLYQLSLSLHQPWDLCFKPADAYLQDYCKSLQIHYKSVHNTIAVNIIS